jgi:hypothetical protein
MTDFITFGEAIRIVGFKKAARMLRQALGIKRQLAPWSSKGDKRGKKQTGKSVVSTRV